MIKRYVLIAIVMLLAVRCLFVVYAFFKCFLSVYAFLG